MPRDTKLITHNAQQVEKWFEFRDQGQKGTVGSYFNQEADVGKPESEPPLSFKGHLSLDDEENSHFRKHVYLPIITKLPGTRIYTPAQILEHNPGALREWKKEETLNQKVQLKKFRRLCKFIATQIERRDPGLRVFYNIHLQDEEARAKTNQAHGQERTINKNHSFRLIGPEVQRVLEEEICTVKAAIARVADMTDEERGLPCSYPRVKAAYYFWKSECEQHKESA